MAKIESEYKRSEVIGYSWRLAVMISVVLGFSVSLLSEILIDLIHGPPNLQELVSMQLSFLVSAAIIGVAYLILWFLFTDPLGRVLKLDLIRLCLSLTAFLGLVYFYYIVHDRLKLGGLPANLNKIFFITVSFVMALFFSVFTYFVSGAILQKAGYRKVATVFSLAMPFVLAEAMVGLCVNKYLIPERHSLYSLINNTVFLFIIIATIILFLLVKRLKLLIRAVQLLVFLAFVLVVPVSLFIQNQPLLTKRNISPGHHIKRVILISIDALRADALSCYDKQTRRTPHIDQLAADGIIFKNAFAPSSWTVPSVVSILTGLSVSVHMTRDMDNKLDDVFPTIAEYMWEKGYITSAFPFNLVLYKRNISRGFMWYKFFPGRNNPSVGMRLLRWLSPCQYGRYISSKKLTDCAVDWIDLHAQEDFFLWIHYYDPHLPYEPPAETLPQREPVSSIGTSIGNHQKNLIFAGWYNPSSEEREWIKELYLSEVCYVDTCVGSFLSYLKELNIYDDSLIIVTSDHGEEFWEHDGFEHGHTLYNELLSVPLIIKLPQNSIKDAVEKAVSINSILPTILDLCKIEYVRELYPDGSLVPLWEGDASAEENIPIISAGIVRGEDRESLIFDKMKYKYIRWLVSNREELYDLTQDPAEKISLVRSAVGKVKQAREVLSAHHQSAQKLKEHYNIATGKTADLDKDTIQQLKSLGYLK